MKKLLYVFVAILSIGLMVGCGEKDKELTCTYNQQTNGINQEMVLTNKWKKGKLDNIVIKTTMVAERDDIKANWSQNAEIFSNYLKQTIIESDGIKLDIDDDTDKYIYTISIDFNKTTDVGLKKLGLPSVVGTDTSYKATKEAYEKSGFTCK